MSDHNELSEIFIINQLSYVFIQGNPLFTLPFIANYERI